MSKRHKLFFALVPDRAVQRQIGKIQVSSGVSGRAVKPEQFHATLAFLGMQQEEVIPRIRNIASKLEFPQCNIRMDRLGCFRRAGVLWLGANVIPDELARFQYALVGALLDAGIGYDRKAWKFHITLYRKMRMSTPIMDPVAIEWPLTSFELIESVSIGNGVKYHSIGQWTARA